ncbi:MAG: amino acid permease [Lachnospiraceae bacterium]|nr:amino acid permease [Lachnospiraceae bacterium]
METQEKQVQEEHLGRYLSPLSVWALSFGCAVGWGAFVMPGTTFLPHAGPVGTIIGISLGAMILFLIGVNYHYLINRYPSAGGTLTYAVRSFGFDQGFLSAWFLLLVYVTLMWANASALTIFVRYFFGPVLQFGFHYELFGFQVYFGEVFVSVLLILLVGLFCIYWKTLSINLQVGCSILLFLGILVLSVLVIFHASKQGMLLSPSFSPYAEDLGLTRKHSPVLQVVSIIALTPWAFGGFESVSNSSEGFRFSPNKTIWIMLAALVTGSISYILITITSAIAIPEQFDNWSQYISQLSHLGGKEGLPVLYATDSALGTYGVVILVFVIASAIITSLIGNCIAASRLMYTMSLDGLLPKAFQRLNKIKSPYIAIWTLVGVSMFIPFFGRTAVNWIVDISTVGLSISYGFTSASAFVTAKKEQNRKIMITGAIGLVTSVLFFLYAMVWSAGDVETESFLLLAGWSLLGLIYYRTVFKMDQERRYGKTPIVWMGLTFLILFSSLVWVRQSANDLTETVVEEISEYYEANHTELSLEALAKTEAFIAEHLEHTKLLLIRNSAIQMCLIVLALILLISIYRTISRREHEAENRRMEMELDREKNEVEIKNDFLFHISHDIRTPMNAILGFTEIARRDPEDVEQVKDCLEHVGSAGKTMMNLIDQLLDMSELNGEDVAVQVEPCDLSEQLEIVMESVATNIQDKELTLIKEIQLPEDLVLADGSKVRRILRNLLDNAVKYTPVGGSVTVRAMAGELSESGYARYEFQIADTGIGMSEEFLENIFKSFHQEATSTESGLSGTGLGLSMVKSLVDMMGGSVNVRSKKEEGSIFTVDFPLKIVTEEKKPLIEVTPKEDLKAEGEYRVLLVEDIELNRKLAERILKKADFLVESVMDGSDAVEKVKDMPEGYYDVILMDIQMPIMNGYEATRVIRQLQREDLQSIPIIALSANAREEDKKASSEAGMNAHLAKPLDVTLLIQTVNEQLKIRKENTDQ